MNLDRIVRKPTQKRSLEKFNNIVDAAFKLFNERGYNNITTVDIAKEANIATGSVYAYFQDKRDIYIQVLNKIEKSFDFPTRDFWLNKKISLQNKDEITSIIKDFIDLMLKHHNFTKTFHDDLEALILQDEVIRKAQEELNKNRFQKIHDILIILGLNFISSEALDIYIHYSNLLIEDVCHSILYKNDLNEKDLHINSCVNMLHYLMLTLVDNK